MIYTKIGELNVEVKPEDLYTKCCKCGKEIHLDDEWLDHIVKEEDFLTIFEIGYSCNECEEEYEEDFSKEEIEEDQVVFYPENNEERGRTMKLHELLDITNGAMEIVAYDLNKKKTVNITDKSEYSIEKTEILLKEVFSIVAADNMKLFIYVC